MASGKGVNEICDLIKMHQSINIINVVKKVLSFKKLHKADYILTKVECKTIALVSAR